MYFTSVWYVTSLNLIWTKIEKLDPKESPIFMWECDHCVTICNVNHQKSDEAILSEDNIAFVLFHDLRWIHKKWQLVKCFINVQNILVKFDVSLSFVHFEVELT